MLTCTFIKKQQNNYTYSRFTNDSKLNEQHDLRITSIILKAQRKYIFWVIDKTIIASEKCIFKNGLM